MEKENLEEALAFEIGYNKGFKDGLEWNSRGQYTPCNGTPNYCLKCGAIIGTNTPHFCNGTITC